MAKRQEINWGDVEHLFVTGTATLSNLAERFKVKPGTMRTRAARGGWTQKRVAHRADLQAALHRVRFDEAVLDRTRFDTLVDQTCDALMARLVVAAIGSDPLRRGEVGEIATAVKTVLEVKYRRLDVPLPKAKLELDYLTAPGDVVADELDKLIAEVDGIVDPRLAGLDDDEALRVKQSDENPIDRTDAG